MKQFALLSAAFVSLLFHSNAKADDSTFDNSRLPSLEEIKPLPESALDRYQPSFFHDVILSVEGNYSYLEHRDGQPARLRAESKGADISLATGLGGVGFAVVRGSFSAYQMESRVVEFPLDLVADAYARDIDAAIGLNVLPFLRMGVTGGIGNGDANYAFTAFTGGSDSDSTSKRLGGFVGGFYPVGPFLLSADVNYLTIWNDQSYAPTNNPPRASWDGEMMTLTLGADYQAMPDLTVWGKVGFNHILSQTVAPADTPNDRNWTALELGATYALSDKIDLKVSGLTWAGNSKFNFTQISAGMNYRF
jgi:hypothetical protein